MQVIASSDETWEDLLRWKEVTSRLYTELQITLKVFVFCIGLDSHSYGQNVDSRFVTFLHLPQVVCKAVGRIPSYPEHDVQRQLIWFLAYISCHSMDADVLAAGGEWSLSLDSSTPPSPNLPFCGAPSYFLAPSLISYLNVNTDYCSAVETVMETIQATKSAAVAHAALQVAVCVLYFFILVLVIADIL